MKPERAHDHLSLDWLGDAGRCAGQNSMIIRTDGTLAPCFLMYCATHDWGLVGNHQFETGQPDSMKQSCQLHCFSTLNHNLAYCYKASRAIKWTSNKLCGDFKVRPAVSMIDAMTTD